MRYPVYAILLCVNGGIYFSCCFNLYVNYFIFLLHGKVNIVAFVLCQGIYWQCFVRVWASDSKSLCHFLLWQAWLTAWNLQWLPLPSSPPCPEDCYPSLSPFGVVPVASLSHCWLSEYSTLVLHSHNNKKRQKDAFEDGLLFRIFQELLFWMAMWGKGNRVGNDAITRMGMRRGGCVWGQCSHQPKARDHISIFQIQTASSFSFLYFVLTFLANSTQRIDYFLYPGQLNMVS